MSLRDLLLPTTDGGVLTQVLIVVALGGWALWQVRDRDEIRLIVIGVILLSIGLAGVRALH